jgi:hypothetical protein
MGHELGEIAEEAKHLRREGGMTKAYGRDAHLLDLELKLIE